MSLYLKYRPGDFAQMRGNEEVISMLSKMLGDVQTCPHAFLLHGPTGCGKTTAGRIIASKLGSRGSDFIELDSADFRGIDVVREIRRNSGFMPSESDSRVWLIDECHKMTNDAQNALLKILEDTPLYVYFILCTTEPQKLLPTLRGRCSTFQFYPLKKEDMVKLMHKIVVREGEKDLDEKIYEQIYSSSRGFPRNALQILEQVLSVPPDKREEVAKKAEAEVVQSIELCRALLKRESWKNVSRILSGLKDQDPENIRRAVLGYCQAVLLDKDEPICGLIFEEFINPFYDSGFPQLVSACYTVTKNR